MTLLAFVAVALGTMVIAIVGRGRPWLASLAGFGGLALLVPLALAIRPDEILEIGGGVVVTSAYARLFLVLGAVLGLVLAFVGVAAGTRRDAPAVSLGTLTGAALALALPDARIAVLAITASGLAAVLATLVPAGGAAAVTIAVRDLRVVVLAGAVAVAAAAWVVRPLGDLAGQPAIFGLAYLGFALAVAARFGAIPFHLWAARLSDVAPEVTLPVVTAWGPAAFAVVALAWIDSSVAPVLPGLDAERSIVLVVAVASVVLAAFAAWIQDDLEHVVAYSIVGDAGIVLLGLAALDPAAWAPARVWILAFIATRSAFAAWAAAVRATSWTGRIDDLRGWAVRSPVLAIAFGLIATASVGFPGLAAFQARGELVRLNVGGALGTIVLLGTLLPVAYYARLAAVGLRRPLRAPRTSGGWRLRGQRVDLTAVQNSGWRLWELNRTALAAVLVVAIAGLAFGVAAGAFGIPDAAAAAPPTLPGGPTD